MTGAEFREARVAAGLSIRQAAARLACSPQTIQNWERADEVPVRAEGISRPAPAPYYELGQVAALVERATGKPLPPAVIQSSARDASLTLGRLMKLLHECPATRRREVDQRIEEVLEHVRIDDLERSLTDTGGLYSLGYYHERAALDDAATEDVAAMSHRPVGRPPRTP